MLKYAHDLSNPVCWFFLKPVSQLATNGNQKHCFYQFLIRDRRLLITFFIAAYPVWLCLTKLNIEEFNILRIITPKIIK